MMNYGNFVEKLGEAISKVTGTDPETKRVLKNNGTFHDVIIISREGKKVAPCPDLEKLYKTFLDGKPLEEIVRDICGIPTALQDVDLLQETFGDYKNVKGHVAYKLINYDMNRKLLETIPHRRFLDLAIVFYYVIPSEDNQLFSILITNKHMLLWGVTAEQVYEDAVCNTPDLREPELVSMESMMRMLLGDSEKIEEIEGRDADEAVQIFVLSNKQRIYGAAAMLYRNILEEFAEKEQTDVYILPSSVHEVILIPVRNDMNTQELNKMVREVNEHELQKEEILSDHAYLYRRNTNQITM